PPASATIVNGQSDTLSVTAADGTPGYTYQWYTGTSGDTTNPIRGANSSSYLAPPTSTTSYWVQITDSANGTAGPSVTDSSTATTTVAQPITSLTFTPSVPPATTASPAGTVVGTLVADDPNPNATVSYSLTTPTGGILTVDSNGVI